MKITITHCRYTSKWETLQTVIRESLNDEGATITRIHRLDGGCNYRDPGKYELDVRQSNNTILPVELDVLGVGTFEDRPIKTVNVIMYDYKKQSVSNMFSYLDDETGRTMARNKLVELVLDNIGGSEEIFSILAEYGSIVSTDSDDQIEYIIMMTSSPTQRN